MPNDSRYIPVVVHIEDLDDDPMYLHHAWIDPTESSDGIVAPWFDRDECERIAAWSKDIGDVQLEYEEASDSYRSVGDPYLQLEFPGADIAGHHLYQIGAGDWLWVVAEEEEGEEQ